MCAIVSGPFPTLSERVFQAAAVQSNYRHGNAPILAFCPDDLYNFLIRLFSFQGTCNRTSHLLTGLSLH